MFSKVSEIMFFNPKLNAELNNLFVGCASKEIVQTEIASIKALVSELSQFKNIAQAAISAVTSLKPMLTNAVAQQSPITWGLFPKPSASANNLKITRPGRVI